MITYKTSSEINLMKEGGSILSGILKEVKEKAVQGVETKDLNFLAEKLIRERGGKPSFKGYGGFPAALCTSVNEVIVHQVPSGYKLKNGDILSLDIGMKYKGFHTDMATTVPIGEVDGEALRLIRTVKKALKRGIKNTKQGNTIGDIGNTISRYIEKSGMSVVEGLCGHGIGRELHEDPQVLNKAKRRSGEKIVPGMVICIEPMASLGSSAIKTSEDNFGIETADKSLSAHFEHAIAVTESGYVVITE